MTNLITYEFEELQPFPGQAVYVTGSADISYEIEPDDAYTGYRGGPIYWISRISLASTQKGVGDLNLDTSHPLYELIENQLKGSEYESHIVTAIERNENDWD